MKRYYYIHLWLHQAYLPHATIIWTVNQSRVWVQQSTSIQSQTAYAAKFYNDSENEDNGEYGNILPSHGSGSYSNMGLFDDDNGTDNQQQTLPINCS